MLVKKHTSLENTSNKIAIGDIMVYTYSYNARYPHFVQVVRRTAKSIWYREIAKVWASNDAHGQNGTRMPVRNNFVDNSEKRALIKINRDGTEYCYSDKKYIYLWNGEPEDEYTD